MRALLLLLLCATAEAKSGEVMLAARAGAFMPQPFSQLGASYLVGVEAGWVPPVWKKRLALSFDLAFSTPGAEGQFQSGAAHAATVSWRAAVREVSMGLQLAFRQAFGRLMPYLALGPRLLVADALIASSAGASRLPTSRESSVALGLSLVPGVGLSLPPGQLFLEMQVVFLWRVGTAPRLTGDFDPGGLAVVAGYRVFF